MIVESNKLLNIKSLLRDNCLKFSDAFLEGFINQSTRMSGSRQSDQIRRSVIIFYSIQMMYNMIWGQWYAVCLFPIKYMLSKIIIRTILAPAGMWFRMIYENIPVFVRISSSIPLPIVLASQFFVCRRMFEVFHMTRCTFCRWLFLIISPFQKFVTIFTTIIFNICHTLMIFCTIYSKSNLTAVRAIFSLIFVIRYFKINVTYNTFLYHNIIIS